MPSPVVGQRSAPQSIDEDLSALCTTGLQPLNITGSLAWILRRHFSDPDLIKDPDLKDCLWFQQPNDTTEEASASSIQIEPVTKQAGFPSQAVQMRPALLVKRNRWVFHKLGMGDRRMGANYTQQQLSNPDVLDNADHYEVLIGGSHTVFAIGGTAGQVEAIATEAYFELLEFAQLIRRDLHLNQFKVNGMEAVGRLEESSEHFVVPILMSYTFFHAWNLHNKVTQLNAI